MAWLAGLALGIYLLAALVDLKEHFRLEAAATGRSWTWQVITPGESTLHGAVIATLLAAFVLARPLPEPLEARDVFVLASPFLFTGLGLVDELVYHRRRCQHREDIMHTTAHLLSVALFAAILVFRVLPGA